MEGFVKFLLILILTGCSSVKYIPVENKLTNTLRDSIVIKDSTVLIPREIIFKSVPIKDTLVIETSVAKSIIYVDTVSSKIQGVLKNKDEIKYKYITKDRIIEKKDSIIIEKPVEIEVEKKVIPKWTWWSLGINVAVILVIVLSVILKLK